VSNLAVVAHVKGLKEPVEIRGVLWPESADEKWRNKKVAIANLADSEDSWNGEGNYVLALMVDPNGGLQIAPIPRSPGSPALKESKDGRRAFLPVRIYPESAETRRQALEMTPAAMK